MAPPQEALDFIEFVNESPTPYHAVQSASARFEKAGFKLIRERDSWASTLRPGGKYYLTRNASTIVAFTIGRKWRPGNPVAIIGAHTDSPCLRLKPVSKKSNVGYLQIGVETYGGGIWTSWFDRDLSIAGRVLVKEGDKFVSKLVKVDKPLVRIPTLAIHLHRQTNFDPNKETELFPIAGLVAAELNKGSKNEEPKEKKDDDEEDEEFKPLKVMAERHHPQVLDVIAAEAGVEVSAIIDFELILYDTQNTIRLIVCFDHEEIGSTSAQGANSNLLPSVIRRLSVLPGKDTASEGSYEAVHHDNEEATTYEQTLSRSFLVSADMAHSVHPNYAGKYESSHQPAMNGGTVIKINANQRYATNSPGIVLLQECARTAGVPLQLFVVRNDSPCGSTIGPGLAAALGMRTLDLGNPQLSMHSIRETGGSADVAYGIKLFKGFFENYGSLEPKILID
ncbi:aspartyl aminopeptidase [Fusarium mexicanum]|uniref:aspartyl aminopeptidase n=1 Tax=Fusarium mexicanum TaxID=751941 RepID=A0A8H5I6X7_9HYPO|nr:aspartyl aminopeptidase [Fusarium mexicanum]